jgi:hypothetical protein
VALLRDIAARQLVFDQHSQRHRHATEAISRCGRVLARLSISKAFLPCTIALYPSLLHATGCAPFSPAHSGASTPLPSCRAAAGRRGIAVRWSPPAGLVGCSPSVASRSTAAPAAHAPLQLPPLRCENPGRATPLPLLWANAAYELAVKNCLDGLERLMTSGRLAPLLGSTMRTTATIARERLCSRGARMSDI